MWIQYKCVKKVTATGVLGGSAGFHALAVTVHAICLHCLPFLSLDLKRKLFLLSQKGSPSKDLFCLS